MAKASLSTVTLGSANTISWVMTTFSKDTEAEGRPDLGSSLLESLTPEIARSNSKWSFHNGSHTVPA